MRKVILKYALQNAIRYNGRADEKAVINKVFSELKDIDKKKVVNEVRNIVNEVNSLTIEEQKEKLQGIAPDLLEKRHVEKGLFDFLGIKERPITCFPPEPSKYLHLGHAKALFLNYELAKRHKGKFIFRFEDTNPLLVKKEFYKVYTDELKWLNLKPDGISYASKNLNKFYKLAGILIKKGDAYICNCSQEKIKELRFKGIPCSCRDFNVKENLRLWKALFSRGRGILRLKIDAGHKNTAMRDPTIFRIINKKHPLLRKKYRVWPTYDFENPAMDGLEKVNYRIRSKEFELRHELHGRIQKLLNFKETRIYEIARLNLSGVPSSGRIIREKIENKELIGWDDPSLSTLAALRRRGFKAEAIKEFVLSTGISKAESVLTWNDLIVYNRRLLDFRANRYFFVENPVKIRIDNAPKLDAKVPLHPEDKKRGFRSFKTNDEFYITDSLEKNKVYRFMNLFNFKNEEFLSKELDKKAKLIHWLPYRKDLIKVEILMPDKTLRKGLAEKSVKKLKVGDVVQFVRFGFCRLDKKEKNKLSFWFTHG